MTIWIILSLEGRKRNDNSPFVWVYWPFKCSDTSTLLRYDVGQGLILERVPAVRCCGDPQGLHGPGDRSAALCDTQHGGGSIPG